MGKYKSFSEQPQEVQLRGDRLIIFRGTVNMLLALDDSQLLILIKPFLKWFSDGGQYTLSDSLMAFVYQKLIDEHMRAFEHAKAKCLKNKENRSKGTIKQQTMTNGDGRQPSSTVVNLRQQVKAKGEVEVEGEGEAKEKENFKSQKEAFPPTKEMFFTWGKKFGIWPIALKKFFEHAESISWKTASGPLHGWRNYFVVAFNNEREKKLKAQDDRFDQLTGYEGMEFRAQRAVLAAKLYTKKHNMTYKTREDENNCITWPDSTGINMEEGYWLLDKSIEAGENEWQYHSGNNNKPNWEPPKV